jgi:hypothetical protein
MFAELSSFAGKTRSTTVLQCSSLSDLNNDWIEVAELIANMSVDYADMESYSIFPKRELLTTQSGTEFGDCGTAGVKRLVSNKLAHVDFGHMPLGAFSPWKLKPSRQSVSHLKKAHDSTQTAQSSFPLEL